MHILRHRPRGLLCDALGVVGYEVRPVWWAHHHRGALLRRRVGGHGHALGDEGRRRLVVLLRVLPSRRRRGVRVVLLGQRVIGRGVVVHVRRRMHRRVLLLR